MACLHGKEHPAEAHGALAEVHVLQERPVLAKVCKGYLQQAARRLLEESSAAEQVMRHVPQSVLRCTVRIREAALLVAGLLDQSLRLLQTAGGPGAKRHGDSRCRQLHRGS